MFQKIHAKLVEKYPGLPKAFLGLIAKQLEAKVTDENAIEGAITELDQQFSIKTLGDEYQREGDRRVTEAQAQWNQKNPQQQQQQQQQQQGPDPKTNPPADEIPAWAKPLLNTIQSLVQEKTQGTIREQAALKLKDIPANYWAKRALPTKVEDLDAFITDVTTDWNDFKQEQINQGFMSADGKPAGGAGAGGGGNVESKTADADIDAWATKEGAKK